MRVRDLMEQLKAAPPEALLCVAEVDEAFAANVASIEKIEDARIEGKAADGREAIALEQGKDTVVVLRW